MRITSQWVELRMCDSAVGVQSVRKNLNTTVMSGQLLSLLHVPMFGGVGH